jgi:hypothetical protein
VTVSGPVVAAPGDGQGATVDPRSETYTPPAGFTVTGYSLDGGKTWTKGAPDLGKLLNSAKKTLNIVLTNGALEGKGTKMKPAEGSDEIELLNVDKRPKANPEKLAAWYDDETWTLAIKGSDGEMPDLDYEWAVAAKNGKPAGAWEPFDPDEGFPVQDAGAKKTTYLFRTAAEESDGDSYTPAGKTFKITPANRGKAPGYKITYKRDMATLKLKKGDAYMIDDGGPEEVEDKTFKLELELPDYSGSTVTFWKAATGKKPETMKKELRVR